MSHQEPEFSSQEDDLQERIGLAQLDINGLDSTTTRHHNYPPCTSCGCTSSSSPSIFHTTTTTTVANNSNPMKRPSPEPTNPNEPKSKKLTPVQQQDTDLSLVGYSKILLPFTLPPNPTHTRPDPILRRCISDPYTSPTKYFPDPLFWSGNSTQSPPDTTPLASSAVKGSGSSALPPLPPTLRRSVSDPISSPAKTLSRSSSSSAERMGVEFAKEESPDSKRLKRIKDHMRQMGQWWDAMLLDEEDSGIEESNDAPPRHLQDDYEPDREENVSVERAGESLIIHFKCPCNKGYQILLSGGNCYYKLM